MMIPIFPLTLKYKRTLSQGITPEKVPLLLDFITQRYTKLLSAPMNRNDAQVVFSNKVFNGQGGGHLFVLVDECSVTVDAAKRAVVFRFSTLRAMLFCVVFSLGFYLLSKREIVGIVAFSFLYGLNMTFSFFRLLLFTFTLKKEMEEYLMQQTDREE